MKSFLHKRLYRWTQKILSRQQPYIIAITGSVGKTSTKDAIVAVLGQKYSVRGSIKNYNNEIGVPLTVLGLHSPGKSIFGWLRVWRKAKKLGRKKDPHYPECLVLEMGADRPGDIAYLAAMVEPDLAVVTAVAPAHTQYLGDMSKVAAEKSALVKVLPVDGVAILNGDDPYVQDMRHETASKVVMYGFGNETVRAYDLSIDFPEHGNRPRGMRGMLSHGDWKGQFYLQKTIGKHMVYPVLAAAAAARALELSLQEVLEGISEYVPPVGRMRILNGIKHTLLIDDTYNSSPKAAAAAVEALAEITPEEGGERYAVLGDMLELGSLAAQSHDLLGRRVAELGIDYLITVGDLGKGIARAAKAVGMEEHRVAEFAKSEEAGRFLQEKMEKGDVVLIKGSQGVRMEKITKEVMAQPLKAEELLVRMDPSWQDR